MWRSMRWRAWRPSTEVVVVVVRGVAGRAAMALLLLMLPLGAATADLGVSKRLDDEWWW
jgi:hypothetical protein